MPNNRRTKIRIRTHEVTIIRFATTQAIDLYEQQDEVGDVVAYEEFGIRGDGIANALPVTRELPEAEVTEEESNESNGQKLS